MLARLMKHGYRICMIFFFFKIGSNCFVSLRASRLSFGISFGFASRRFRGFITRLRLLGSQINNAIMTYYVAADNKQCCIIVVKMAANLKRTFMDQKLFPCFCKRKRNSIYVWLERKIRGSPFVCNGKEMNGIWKGKRKVLCKSLAKRVSSFLITTLQFVYGV